jgi:uncharacterized protein YecT (DUF1311 family)
MTKEFSTSIIAGVIFLGFLVLAGCGMSREQIAESTTHSMQETFDSKPEMKDWHLTVTSVQVVKLGDNRYRGDAKVVFEGESNDVMIDITTDGKNIAWSTSPSAFLFVEEKIERDRQKQLEDRYVRVAMAVNGSQAGQLSSAFGRKPIKTLSKDEYQRQLQFQAVEELCSEAENAGAMGVTADTLYPGLTKACLGPSANTVASAQAAPEPTAVPAPEPVAAIPAAPAPEPTAVPAPKPVAATPAGPATQGIPSFDCAKASTAVEKLICSNAELADADSELALFYKKNIVASGADAGSIRQGQKAFIAIRNQCDTATCIAEAYRSRHEELTQLGYVRQ